MDDFIKQLRNLTTTLPTVVKNNVNSKAARPADVDTFNTASGTFRQATKQYRPDESVGLGIRYRDNKNNLRAGLLIVDRESANNWYNGGADSLDVYGMELDNGSSLDFSGVKDLMRKYDKNHGEIKSKFIIPDQNSFNEGNYIGMGDGDMLQSYREYMSDKFPSKIRRVKPFKKTIRQIQPSFYSRLKDTYK